MRSKGNIESLLMMLGGIIILVAILFSLSEWRAIRETQPPKQIETGCLNDDSKCAEDPKGNVCKKISESKEKIEYLCVCLDNDNCPPGKKCKREAGRSYGFCE